MTQLRTIVVQQDSIYISPRVLPIRIFEYKHIYTGRSPGPGIVVFATGSAEGLPVKEICQQLSIIITLYRQEFRLLGKPKCLDRVVGRPSHHATAKRSFGFRNRNNFN